MLLDLTWWLYVFCCSFFCLICWLDGEGFQFAGMLLVIWNW